MYFQQILDFIVTVHSNQIAAEPHNLKLTSLPKILAEYFSHPSTSLQSNETGYPFCTWKKYRILADQFVAYFSNQISTEVCEEEAIVLVNAFLKEGQCDSIFMRNNHLTDSTWSMNMTQKFEHDQKDHTDKH